MKLIMPQNIYSSIFASQLKQIDKIELLYNQSSLLSKDLEFNTSAVALIPSLDLINHRNLFVSSKFALSFDGALSNSFLYFTEGKRNLDKLFIRGDISINDILLTKIIFPERYSSNPEISLDPSSMAEKGKDYIVSGDENFSSWNFKKAISIADEISELIDYPYVNYVFASPDKDAVEKFNDTVNPLDIQIDEDIEIILKDLSLKPVAESFIIENLGSLYYDMTDNEMNAVNELMKLIFYHGIIDDMFDVKFL